jgi:hypothetical protein
MAPTIIVNGYKLGVLCLLMVFGLASLSAQTVIPPGLAAPAGAVDTGLPGFKLKIHQLPILVNRFPGNQNSLANAERQLADGYIDPATAMPYANEATPNPADSSFIYEVPGVINFSEWGAIREYGNFVPDADVPGIPGLNFSHDNYVVEVLTYLALPAGTNVLGVNSDEGFLLSIGVGTNPQDAFALPVAMFDGGRIAFQRDPALPIQTELTESKFSLVVQQADLYPVRLLWWEGSGRNGGETSELEFYSLSGTNRILINDPIDPAAIKAYREATLKLYARSVSPKPNAVDAAPQAAIKIELVDQSTQLNPGSVSLRVDGALVTPTINKVGGVTTVAYTPATIATACSPHTATLIYSDNGVPVRTVTNTWSFTTANYLTLPPSLAVPTGAVNLSATGFAVKVFQIDPNRPFGDDEFSVSRADLQLSGLRTMPNSATLYPNIATPSSPGNFVYTETQVINYHKDGPVAPATGAGNFRPDALIPGIPGTTGSVDNFAQEVVTYLELAPGAYTMGVNSDEGFRVTTAANVLEDPASVVGIFNSGHLESDVTFSFVVTQAGYYPFRLVWFDGMGSLNQEGATFPNFDAYVEWYSVSPSGQKILINDRSQAGAIKAYRAVTVTQPYVKSVNPTPGQLRVPVNTSLSLSIADGTYTVVSNSVQLNLNGQAVTPVITRTGAVTTASYQPAGALPYSSLNTAVWSYSDTNGNSYSKSATFRTKRTVLQEDASGFAVVEAEDYDAQIPPTDPDATVPSLLFRFTDANPLPTKIDFSGDGYLHLTPNAGTAPDQPAFVPQLEYQVVFTHAGTNWLWGRGAAMDTAADSCYFSLDGDLVAGPPERRIAGFRSEWTWSRSATPLDVPSAGLHKVTIWMREDGMYLDKLLLTTNEFYRPDDLGPVESELSALPLQLKIYRLGPSVVVSWDSLGTLQTADSVTGPWMDMACPSPLVETPSASRKFYRLRR